MNTRSSFLVAGALLLAALGCREDTTSPTASAPVAPQAAVAAATPLSFWQLSGGALHTCGVTIEYQPYCWGLNSQGQLGNGANSGPETCAPEGTIGLACSTRPTLVTGGFRLQQVAAGGYTSCGVTTDNRVYCWGANAFGKLGNGTNTGPKTCTTPYAGDVPCSTRPVLVSGGLAFRQVDVGDYHTCALTTANRAYCWGLNSDGQLGDGTNTSPQICPAVATFGSAPCSTRPVAVVGGLTFKQVKVGSNHTCGITTLNRAFCWGGNRSGQLGDSTNVVRRLRPTRVSWTYAFAQVDAGNEFTCAVTTGDRAFCWGNGRGGQLGNGKTYLSSWPRAVLGGLSIRRVTTGGAHACGESTTNRGYCWGENSSGQLGDGTTARRLKPVAVVSGLYFRQLTAAGSHSCGKAPAVGYCWGSNEYGQLGDGTKTNRLRPTRVLGPT